MVFNTHGLDEEGWGPIQASYLQGLLELKSMGAVVMVLALKQRLSQQGYYWYNLPKSAGFPFRSWSGEKKGMIFLRTMSVPL